MYRMLIVDDEPEIVENLYELFMGEGFPQLDIMRTSSSREALSTINSVKVDILLTDIRMPGTTGMQLADAARKNWPKSRLIFLTGYNEFEYAYSAIKNDCEDYLLKTESDRVILETVRATVEKLEKSLKDEELLGRAKNQMKLLAPVLQRDFFLSLVDGVAKPVEVSREKFGELGLDFDPRAGVFAFIGSIDGLPHGGSGSPSGSEYAVAVRLIAQEALERYARKVLVEYETGMFLCLVQKEENASVEEGRKKAADAISLLKGTVETIQNVSRESLQRTVSFALCCEQLDWENFGSMVRRLKKMLAFCSGIGREAFVTDRSFESHVFERINSKENELLENSVSNLRSIQELSSCLERGMKEEYFCLLTKMTSCLRGVNSCSNNLALEIYYSVSNCLLSYINRWKAADAPLFKADLQKLMRPDVHDSWNGAVDYLFALSEELFSSRKTEQDETATASVKHVQHYILNHLNEELSLDKLANSVYLNPSYLSRLFKKVTGVNLSQYIMEARISKARALLSETDLKVHELAQMVGMESAIYFARAFKKAVNMTPQEYRESCYKR